MASPARRTLAGALVAAALAGCGDDGEGTRSPITTTTTQAERPDEAPEVEGQAADDSGSGSGSAETESSAEGAERPTSPEDVIAAVLTRSGSPEQACEQLVTERFVRLAYGGLEGCRAARAPGATARSVRVRDVEESGDRATAVAVPNGGPYDGIEVKVELAADQGLEGAWLVDSLVADVPPGP